jgi:adenylate cyclase
VIKLGADGNFGETRQKIERRNTTIVAADLVGYSRLVAADETAMIDRFRGLRDEIIIPGIHAASGRIVKTMGDGMLMEFESAEIALRAALDVQRKMQRREADVPEDRRMRFRIGINTGDAIIDGDDVLGDVVNIAARLESLAPPGGICLSQSAREKIGDDFDAEFTSLGLQYVKNLPVPVDVWNVRVEGVLAEPDTPTKHSERPSIAVLAFENLSSSPDQEFLADGIAADVTTQLARFRSLFVIARNSAFSYKNTHRDVRQIAHELGVSYVVEGSIRNNGSRIRVAVTLLHAKSGEHLWSNKWDRDITDIFEVQDELTKAIVNELAPELGANERALAQRKPTENLTAWELCQRGMAEFYSYTVDGYQNAFELFHASARADPNFALPRAQLGRWHSVMVVIGRSQNAPGDLMKGIEHAASAIRLDDRLEDGHIAMGSILGMMRRETEAFQALDRAYALNDNNAFMFHARTYVHLFQEEIDCDGMEAAARSAILLNPRDPVAWGFHFMLASALWNRDLKNGYIDAADALITACNFPQVEYFPLLATAYLHVRLGEMERAKHYLDRALEKRPDLTHENWRNAFTFPTWPKMVESLKDELEVLVTLGLPRV